MKKIINAHAQQIKQIRAPKDQNNARICDRYFDGSNFMIMFRSNGKSRVISLRYFIKELIKDVPPEYYK